MDQPASEAAAHSASHRTPHEAHTMQVSRNDRPFYGILNRLKSS